MNLVEIKVEDRTTGERHTAALAVCECGCQQFLAYQVREQDHFHLQCVACGESFCPTGGCRE